MFSLFTGDKLHSLPFSRSEDVTGMSLSPDESRLMAIGDKGHMVLYDTTTWDNIASFKVDDQVRQCFLLQRCHLSLLFWISLFFQAKKLF